MARKSSTTSSLIWLIRRLDLKTTATGHRRVQSNPPKTVRGSLDATRKVPVCNGDSIALVRPLGDSFHAQPFPSLRSPIKVGFGEPEPLQSTVQGTVMACKPGSLPRPPPRPSPELRHRWRASRKQLGVNGLARTFSSFGTISLDVRRGHVELERSLVAPSLERQETARLRLNFKQAYRTWQPGFPARFLANGTISARKRVRASGLATISADHIVAAGPLRLRRTRRWRGADTQKGLPVATALCANVRPTQTLHGDLSSLRFVAENTRLRARLSRPFTTSEAPLEGKVHVDVADRLRTRRPE